LTETELIERLRKGEQQAYRLLYATYSHKVFNTALGIVQQEQDAENIVQEVFIRVYNGIQDFRQKAALQTWLYRMAVNASLDCLRSRNRLYKAGMPETELQVPDFHHPGVVAENKENAALLFKALRRLPDNQMAAFVLQKTEGLSLAEIAAVMQLSEGAVESLLSRAKANLRRLLENLYKDGYQ
jgi:RNA polymerase sigma factor (sigma-70 family)